MAGLSIVLAVVLLLVNLRDEAPSPEALELARQSRERPAVAERDNGYVYAMGFEAAPGKDPQLEGAKRIAWMETAPVVDLDAPQKDPMKRGRGSCCKRDEAVRTFVEACQPNAIGCPVAFDAPNPALVRWQSSALWLLKRYRSMLEREGWREDGYGLSMPIPDYALIRDGQYLLLMEARDLAAQQEVVGVRRLLASDARYWRMVFASSDTLITRMISAVSLARNLRIGSLVIRRLDPSKQGEAIPDEWRAPLSAAELSMMRVLVGEWTFSGRVLREAQSMHSSDAYEASIREQVLESLSKSLYQPQATLNASAKVFLETVRRLDVPLTQYEAISRDYEASEKQKREARANVSADDAFEGLSWQSLYNPMGQVLVAIGPDYSIYAIRSADLEGARRAAMAAATLRQAKVAPDAVAAALEHLPETLKNPYNGTPLEWDAQTRSVLFRGLESGPRREHRIPY